MCCNLIWNQADIQSTSKKSGPVRSVPTHPEDAGLSQLAFYLYGFS